MTSESICGDPRDKIFAILGILDNEEAWLANEMKPDYAISVVELYKRVVKASIQLEERLTILKYCHVAANEAWQPTGAPNWAGPRDQCAVFDLQYADLTMLAQLPKISGDLLAVKGLQAATVADVEPIQLSQSTDFDGQVMELKRLYARFSGDLSVDNSNWFESISHAVSQSKFTEHEILPFSRNRLASVAVLEETLRSIVNSRQGTSTGFSEENGSLKPEFFMFNAHIRETCLGRCFARTDSGHLMLVPDQTRSNDVLAILFGLSLVIVLRPKADHKHRVVGVCFAHGLNWGEALAGPFPPQWRTMKRYRTDGWFDMGFRNLKTEEVTTLDPRIDWEELRVEESDSRRDAVLSEHGQGPYRRPDEAYLQSRGVNVETFQLV
ncbi:hypothetical protein OHC33_009012 [Knufia fluminis]|uniref:Uncharacterized protein n=2 Tax=Knufia TaxID=430999 RepID=A0AAN8EBG0_9EURO|nr:hypothetical protein OHC33_009012 [Knufia fluminis]